MLRETRSLRQVTLWPYTQVMHARGLLSLVTQEPMADLPPLLHRYERDDAFAERPGSRRRYVDDNGWVAMAQEQQRRSRTVGSHGRSVAPAPSARAVALLDWLTRFVDDDGGARWVEGGDARHACSTGTVGVALALSAAPGDERHRTAARCSRFLREVLADDDGIVRDNIDAAGNVEATRWSYNQGLAVRLDVALAHLGDDDALDRARAWADAGLAAFADSDQHRSLWQQPIAFNAVWFRGLLSLATLDGEGARTASTRRTLTTYADGVRLTLGANDLRLPPPSEAGPGRYQAGESEVLDLAGCVQVLALDQLDDSLLDLVV
jgi:hypothetical protein